jgi:TPR repeat protein
VRCPGENLGPDETSGPEADARRGRAGIDALNRLSAEDIARRLSGTRPEVAAFIREAAEAGSAEAQARYAQMLLDGDGVARDQPQAVGWFERAAHSGHLEAANMIGRCHDLGWGVPVDKRVAAAWYRQAAARGYVWAKYNYATLLALGDGVAEDKPQALALFLEAANAGNAKAHNFVGSFHEDGWVVERDLEKAAHHYAIAATGGDFRGQFNHARMLAAKGALDKAVHWMERAWEGGNARFRGQMVDYLFARGEPFRSMILQRAWEAA